MPGGVGRGAAMPSPYPDFALARFGLSPAGASRITLSSAAWAGGNKA